MPVNKLHLSGPALPLKTYYKRKQKPFKNDWNSVPRLAATMIKFAAKKKPTSPLQ